MRSGLVVVSGRGELWSGGGRFRLDICHVEVLVVVVVGFGGDSGRRCREAFVVEVGWRGGESTNLRTVSLLRPGGRWEDQAVVFLNFRGSGI